MKYSVSNAKNAYQVYQNRKLVLPMLGDALRSRYRFSTFTFLVIVLSLVYTLFPFDLLPDFIPVIGWVDDGIWVFLMLQQLKKETIRYGRWRMEKEDRFHPRLFLKS